MSLAPVGVIGSAEDLSAFVDCSVDFVIAIHGRGFGTKLRSRLAPRVGGAPTRDEALAKLTGKPWETLR